MIDCWVGLFNLLISTRNTGRQLGAEKHVAVSVERKVASANMVLGGDNGVTMPELWKTGGRDETQDPNMEKSPAWQL